MDYRYISVTETAKLVREALKKAFPTTKFSVTSKSYTGGASITVRWNDGPCGARVEKITSAFEGADFDGMQDLKTYHKTEVKKPDGTTEMVRYGADYIFGQRNLTGEEAQQAIAEKYIYEHCRCEGHRFANQNVNDLARKMIFSQDHEKNETLENVFQRIVCSNREAEAILA